VCLDVKSLLGPMTGSFFFKAEGRYCLVCPGLLLVTREETCCHFFTEQIKLTLLLTVSWSVFLSRPCWGSWQAIRLLIEYYCLPVLGSPLERACRPFRGRRSPSVPVILVDQLLLFWLTYLNLYHILWFVYMFIHLTVNNMLRILGPCHSWPCTEAHALP